jgi:hypothetical protein
MSQPLRGLVLIGRVATQVGVVPALEQARRRRDFISGVAGFAGGGAGRSRRVLNTVSRIGLRCMAPPLFTPLGSRRYGPARANSAMSKARTFSSTSGGPETPDQLPELAVELVRMNIDLIFALWANRYGVHTTASMPHR